MKKYSKNEKKRYALNTYKPTKNAKSVVYNGVTYASKIQCMVLNDLERKELDEYLKNVDKDTVAVELEDNDANVEFISE